MTTDAPNGPFARLLALDGDAQPAELVLNRETNTLGRAASCELVVSRPTVSRLHARIVRDGPRYLLHDSASANGTFVNGQRIQEPHLLTDRDQIGLGTADPILRFIDPDPTVIPASRLRYDERAMRFSLGPDLIDLTPTEFKLLRHLHQHAGAVRTREQCAEAIWGPDFVPGMDADALDRVVSNVRAKLRRLDPNSTIIQTRPGLGYELVS